MEWDSGRHNIKTPGRLQNLSCRVTDVCVIAGDQVGGTVANVTVCLVGIGRSAAIVAPHRNTERTWFVFDSASTKSFVCYGNYCNDRGRTPSST